MHIIIAQAPLQSPSNRVRLPLVALGSDGFSQVRDRKGKLTCLVIHM